MSEQKASAEVATAKEAAGDRTGDVQAAVEAGKRIATLALRPMDTEDGGQYVLVPEGFTLAGLPRAFPARHRGRYRFSAAEDFGRYLAAWGNAGTMVVVPVPQCKEGFQQLVATAFVNEGCKGSPDWGDHIADLVVDAGADAAFWSKVFGRSLGQQELAEVIEDRMHTIAAPDAGTLLEAVTNLKVNQNVSFQSAVTLRNGATQLAYVDTRDESAGAKGTLTLPGEIALAFDAYEDGHRVGIQVRLRYRLGRDRALTFSLHPICLQTVVRQAWTERVDALAKLVAPYPMYRAQKNTYPRKQGD